jgi:hypothetical protein
VLCPLWGLGSPAVPRFRSAALALGLAGIGLLVGWLVLGSGRVEADADTVDVIVAAGTLATALGTVVLGAATVFLGVKTRDVVDATQAEAQAARDELAIARDQLQVANASLEAQTQPFLTVGDTSRGFLNNSTVHIRNVGNGTAIVTSAVFISPEEVVSAAAVDPAMPTGESTSVRPAVPLVDTGMDNFSVAVAFADVSGRPRGAVRLDVYREPEAAPAAYQEPTRWRVRQVFWADTLEAVRDAPAFGSQPVD